MGRFRSTDGPLTLAAATGPRSVLLCFDIAEDAAELRDGLKGFVLKRRAVAADQESDVAADAKSSTWLGDPRRRLPVGAESSGWLRVLYYTIEDFKWGDYTVEPGRNYEYTLFCVYGDVSTVVGTHGTPDTESLPTEGPGLHVGRSVVLVVATPALYGLLHEVHFNCGVAGSQRYSTLLAESPAQESPDESGLWKWLSRGLEEALLHFIDSAEGPGWHLYGALYEAHYVPVMRALRQAHDRGVQVSLIIDWKMGVWSDSKKTWTQKGPQHLNAWALHEAGLEGMDVLIPRTKAAGISHNKFFVLTSPSNEEEPVAVWTGSTNITSGAIFGHANVGHTLREPELCRQYLRYWHMLKTDPDKKDFVAFNEKLSPLPENASAFSGALALFSPRLQWAAALDFFSQLVLSAKECVAFTAAFGISKELAPALLGLGEGEENSAIKYILMEGEGNWAAARDTYRKLKRMKNVRVATGAHLSEPPTEKGGHTFRPEVLTGLNEHVKYIHTKILLIDPFSEMPVVVCGSANFSKASMDSNDENMVVVRGNTDLADLFAVEFFRLFEHMWFRNQLEGTAPQQQGGQLLCKCNVAAQEQTVRKPGPTMGRKFWGCSKQQEGCGYFKWSDDVPSSSPGTPLQPENEKPPWPERCFDSSSFDTYERRIMGNLGSGQPLPPRPVAVVEAGGQGEDSFVDGLEEVTAGLQQLGIADDEAQDTNSSSAKLLRDAATAGALEATWRLLDVDSNQRGGSTLFRESCDALRASVEQLPTQAAQDQCRQLLDAMQRDFVAKTKGSWRPFGLSILQVLGEDAAKIARTAQGFKCQPASKADWCLTPQSSESPSA